MSTDKLQRDHAVLEGFLSKRVASDKSLRPLEKKPDKNYGVIYAFDFTPCCYLLRCGAWINPVTPGIFFRCFFEQTKDEASRQRVRECIELINYTLPAGCFAVSSTGEVLFKHAVYFGKLPLTNDLLEGLFEPSYEFIGMHWQTILNAILGTSIGIHNH